VNFHAPQRPAELAESQLLEAILEDTFPINSVLPAERDLARQLGVTRPTLREALQRLNRDGWIEIRQGKSTRIRDFWREGNLTILGTLARRAKPLSPVFVSNLLQVRTLLAPTYFRMALENEPHEVLILLSGYQVILDDPVEFTRLDWVLHSRMSVLSGNPVFSLILNGFSDLYRTIGPYYFSNPVARDGSRAFYRNLYILAGVHDYSGVEIETRQVMEESENYWHAGNS
jgi:GntR family negative regulator for fad regulon and positive regulator of fabA